MIEVQFRREKGALGGHITYAEVAGRIVGTWESPGLVLAVRTGTLMRPLPDEKLDVVRMGNWTKREWQRRVRDFAADDQRYRTHFWAKIAEGA